MADSVTYEEFRKQERKKSANHTASPTDTESTILEDLQSTVSEVQDNLRRLTHKSIKEGAEQKWEREQLKTSFAEYQKSMTQQMEQYAQRIQDLESKLSEVKDETAANSSESSIWEINSISSEQDHDVS
jgi:septin family protein